MPSDLPAKPPDVDKLDNVGSVQPRASEEQTPEEGRFSKLMNDPSTTSSKTATTNPMELANQAQKSVSSPPTIASIQQQMTSVSGSLGDIKNQLHTKGLKLKQSEKYLLRNKLSSVDDNLRNAAKQTGADTGPPVNLLSKKSPIAKFLELVTDGQNQMQQASKMVNQLDSSGKSINAGQLLLIQAKLQKAQQELDYTSILLGKATDMLKTLFNVQI